MVIRQGARVRGHTTTAMHNMSAPPPPASPLPSPAGALRREGRGGREEILDGSIYDERAELEEDAAMPLGKEPQLWEFARDVVTSLVSDLAVVSGRA